MRRLRWFALDGHTEVRSDRLVNFRQSSTSAVASHRLSTTSSVSPDASGCSRALPRLRRRLQKWRWASPSPPAATSWRVTAPCVRVLKGGGMPATLEHSFCTGSRSASSGLETWRKLYALCWPHLSAQLPYTTPG